MAKKIFIILVLIILVFPILYLVGPHPAKPKYIVELPKVPVHDLYSLRGYVQVKEFNDQPIKEGNEAEIIWANDSIHTKTPYAIVYLHGFSASHEEGNPVHKDIAKKYGMNMFLPRLSEHGKSVQEPLLKFTVDKVWKDAQEALAIGKELGEKVILLSTSTGGTLSLKLCAEYPEIAAQILMSPNVAIHDSKAWLLNKHWGLQIAHQVLGGNYKYAGDTSAIYAKYWNRKYRIEALTQLEELIETTMTPATFSKVKQPTLMMYYYKDENHQDMVVSVDAMLKMFDQLATPAALKQKTAIPEAGDHAIGSEIKSKDWKTVELEINKFLTEKLQISPSDQ
ncbi:MAG: alpha/beta hydrolase [Saprospiraceae bacterium]